jgi:hypothetical protein
MAYAAGKPRLISDEFAAETYKQVGYEIAGWFQFQPIFDRIFKDNPDIVD